VQVEVGCFVWADEQLSLAACSELARCEEGKREYEKGKGLKGVKKESLSLTGLNQGELPPRVKILIGETGKRGQSG